jgi:hypothetical protein
MLCSQVKRPLDRRITAQLLRTLLVAPTPVSDLLLPLIWYARVVR